MSSNTQIIQHLMTGVSNTISDEIRNRIETSIQSTSESLENVRLNKSSRDLLRGAGDTAAHKAISNRSDSDLYTDISNMINGSNSVTGGVSQILDNLIERNKKYFSIIRDYEIMPMLIPQINRVLMFLVNECLSPDIQNDRTFTVKYMGTTDTNAILADVEAIKKEMGLDRMLRDVYMNRYILGREYYLVVDYNKTFDKMTEMIRQKSLNEATSAMSDVDFINECYSKLRTSIDTIETTCELDILTEDKSELSHAGKQPIIESKDIELQLKDLNIIIERSAVAKYIEDAHAELLAESYASLSIDHFLSTDVINEATIIDQSKLETLISNIRKKKLRRCMIERLDPAKVFKLRIGGRNIGCFYTTDINEKSDNVVNFSKLIKDKLVNSRVTNLNSAYNSAEKVISRTIAEEIINKFDKNIGINRVEDIDLLHDYVLNNEIFKGNKRVTFYYMDEIFDMSRAGESILTNAVYFTKLYSVLMLNNIETKVLRGRGRQIHTVQMGASENVQRYIKAAMANLVMPEANLGMLRGTFEQVLNPFNGSSDIILPAEDGTEKFISTDYIPGQDVDMNDEFLKTILNSIITSFGLDSAVLDTTNGNVQFARTLSMESLQIANSVRNEQNDLHDSWESMCLNVFKLMGEEKTINAVNNGQIKIEFFAPKSLLTTNSIEDINNSKSYAETIADTIAQFNEDNDQATASRDKFVELTVRKMSNVDWAGIDTIVKEANIARVSDALDASIRKTAGEYMTNVEEQNYGDTDNNGIQDSDEPKQDDSAFAKDDADVSYLGSEDDMEEDDL